MAKRALKTCSTPGCPELVTAGRCDTCKAKAEAERGTAAQRGYDSRHRRAFRRAVLAKQPLCVCTTIGHGHGVQCLRPSRHADHHPVDRRTLELRGENPNDPKHGRGLCGACHSWHTSQDQPGGWNAQ